MNQYQEYFLFCERKVFKNISEITRGDKNSIANSNILPQCVFIKNDFTS